MTVSKPGFWQSNLTEEQAISASKDFSQLECSSNGDLYWVEQRPDEQGRNVLCRFAGGEGQELTAVGYSVQSKVHEYGGRSWALLGERLVFVNGSDQQLYVQSAFTQELPVRLTDADGSRFIEPVWDKKRDRLIAVEEVHKDSEVINRLVAVDLASGTVQVLHQGHDFYSYPAMSEAGDLLAFISWDHPEQPWTSTQLNLAQLNEVGAVKVCKTIAGSNGDEALSQPDFLADDRLGFISDRLGFWNIYKSSLAGELIEHLEVAADVMPAPWQSGLKSCAAVNGVYVWVEQEHSGARLHWSDQDITPSCFTQFRSLAACEDRVYCVAAGPEKLPKIISISKDGKEIQEVSKAAAPLAETEISKPVAMEFGEENKSYGYFYPACNSSCSDEGVVPVVVFLHGGPTASTYPVLNLKIQYWTQRGFSVVDLNYRGSSGYGRDYRMSLKGQWGVAEVEDIKQCLQQLIEENWIDPEAVFIRGNSSGGYSALNAMCELDCFTGGASLYGVTDPLSLCSATHKFESRYLDWLIGSPEMERERYDLLAPVNKAEQISCPVIFFQGELDKVVVPEQTRAMVEQLNRKGLKTKAVYFEDEAHGFRKRSNQINVLQDELSFYQEVLSSNK